MTATRPKTTMKRSSARTAQHRTLRRHEAGAVYIEFLIAFLPIFILFLSLSQMFLLQSAQLMTEHAANVAARAAIVVLRDDPRYYAGLGGDTRAAQGAAIHRAAAISLGHFSGRRSRAPVDVTWSRGGKRRGAGGLSRGRNIGPNDQVEVEVKYEYECRIPIGNRIACGANAKLILSATATLTNHGARYEYGGPTH